jgi:hypothetical protein
MLKLLNLIPFTAFGTRLITTDSKDDLSKLSSSEILKVAHNTRKAIFVEANAKDDGGPTSNRFILAKRWKESGAPLTVEVVNSLVNSDNQITQSQFDYFAAWDINCPDYEFDLPLSSEDRIKFNSVLGSVNSSESKINAKGIYVFRDAASSELLYLGSSKHLGGRVLQYLTPSRQAKFAGLWGKYIRSNPTLEGVKVGFFILPSAMEQFYLALEQYFLLSYVSLFNVLIISSPGVHFTPSAEQQVAHIAREGHTTHMYLADRSARVHSFLSVRDAAKQLGSINHNSIAKGINNDRVVKGFYFSKEVLPNAIDAIRPIEVLQDQIANAVVVKSGGPKKRG